MSALHEPLTRWRRRPDADSTVLARVVVAVASGILLVLLSGCGGSSPDASPSDGSGSGGTSSGLTASTPGTTSATTKPVQPPPAAPATAECRNLAFSDTTVFFNGTKTEPCSKPHTAYTYAVPTLPGAIAFKGVQIQNQSVQTAAADKCRTAFISFIGGNESTRALSRLTFTYFLPDQLGFDLGAHWVRCDVVARQSAKTLGDLPGRLAGFLDKAGPRDTYGVCSNGEPGSTDKLVMCTQAHTYRAIAAIRLGAADAAYPGTGTTLSSGKQQCQDLVARQLGVTGGFTYSWTYPSNDDWLAGQRFGYCWNQTDH